MSVMHHIDSVTASRYASGDLDEAFATVVAAHLSFCSACRHAVRTAEEIGGSLLEAEPAEPVSQDTFERTMAMVEQAEDIAVRMPVRYHEAAGDVPAPLRRFVGPMLDGIDWKTVAPGVKKHDIALENASSSLYMLHIGPGKAMPEHGHGGAEITLVLSGAYRDRFGRFGPGDVADLDEHVEHQPVVEPDEACICLVAAEAPTRFKGLIGRMMQPFVGI